jgi:hypothetical protein
MVGDYTALSGPSGLLRQWYLEYVWGLKLKSMISKRKCKPHINMGWKTQSLQVSEPLENLLRANRLKLRKIKEISKFLTLITVGRSFQFVFFRMIFDSSTVLKSA